MSLDETAICVADDAGKMLAEKKLLPTPDAIAAFIADRAPEVARVSLETGPLSVRLHADPPKATVWRPGPTTKKITSPAVPITRLTLNSPD